MLQVAEINTAPESPDIIHIAIKHLVELLAEYFDILIGRWSRSAARNKTRQHVRMVLQLSLEDYESSEHKSKHQPETCAPDL